MIDKDYERKLKNEMTVYNLQQIAEVDDEDSDDAYGPVDIGIGSKAEHGYNSVSNSPSYKADPSRHESKNGLDNDNFPQPTPEIEVDLEEQPDANSSIASSKKKKKSKKTKKRRTKKSSAIVAI
jgi:hypothetical protein